MVSKQTIDETLIGMVNDLIQDWGLEQENSITPDTLIVNDLEFASVDIIQLCVAIEQHYERKIGFQDLLMKNGSYVSDLSIAQFRDYIFDKLNRD